MPFKHLFFGSHPLTNHYHDDEPSKDNPMQTRSAPYSKRIDSRCRRLVSPPALVESSDLLREKISYGNYNLVVTPILMGFLL